MCYLSKMKFHAEAKSKLGPLLLVAEEDVLIGCYFIGEKHVPALDEIGEHRPGAAIFQQAEQELQEFSRRARIDFSVPIRFCGTPFQEAVWKALVWIPFGKTISYTELAQRAGYPHAVRAVGAAVGQNPLSWIVPCHRVIGSNGAITGYAGGLERKRALLDFEAAGSEPQEYPSQDFFINIPGADLLNISIN